MWSKYPPIWGLLFFLPSGLHAQPTLSAEPLSPRIANYQIDVRLTPETRTLTGKQVLTWYNRTRDTVDELRFHLYLNAFRDERSTFMTESGGIMRGEKIGKDGWGFIEVERITMTALDAIDPERIKLHQLQREEISLDRVFPRSATSSEDLTSSMELIQPDDGNKQDKTVFRLPLPVPLGPSQAVSLDIDFTAKLPTPPFARTGAKEEYFFVGQWFPKVGVFEDGAWNCHQFHANSEFYADFGIYDVSITLPRDFVVGATGQLVERKDNPDGTATHHYYAEDVHDFAWTASPEFLVFEDTVQDVKVRALVQPDHAAQGERHLEAAKVAVVYFQDHYGDYPYPNLTVVDPRRGAGGSGGMEYPTLITAGTFYGLPRGVRMLEAVIIHEFGHNFWYHLVASNEFEEPWLDEGVNTYTHSRIMNDTYGPEGDLIDFMGFRFNNLDLLRLAYVTTPKTDPVYRNAWEFYDSQSFAVNSLMKPALILETLRNFIGPETMRAVLKTYLERWRFRHPKTQDFIDVVNEVTGRDWSGYFEQALFSTAVLDYAVTRVRSTEIRESFSRTGGGEEDAANEKGGPYDSSKRYLNEVVVRRMGEFQFPVELDVVFEDGETIREDWHGREHWKRYVYTRPVRVKYATVDPERKIPLDVSWTNNSRTRERQRLGINRAAMKWLFFWQCLLDLLSL